MDMAGRYAVLLWDQTEVLVSYDLDVILLQPRLLEAAASLFCVGWRITIR